MYEESLKTIQRAPSITTGLAFTTGLVAYSGKAMAIITEALKNEQDIPQRKVEVREYPQMTRSKEERKVTPPADFSRWVDSNVRKLNVYSLRPTYEDKLR